MAQDQAIQRPLASSASRSTPTFGVIQPQERIVQLREELEKPENERQRANILTLIRMYENGELGPLRPGHTPILVCNGEIWDYPFNVENLPPPESAKWLEAIFYQMSTWIKQ